MNESTAVALRLVPTHCHARSVAFPWGSPQLNAHHAFGADNCVSASGHEHGWCQPAFGQGQPLCLSVPQFPSFNRSMVPIVPSYGGR